MSDYMFTSRMHYDCTILLINLYANIEQTTLLTNPKCFTVSWLFQSISDECLCGRFNECRHSQMETNGNKWKLWSNAFNSYQSFLMSHQRFTTGWFNANVIYRMENLNTGNCLFCCSSITMFNVIYSYFLVHSYFTCYVCQQLTKHLTLSSHFSPHYPNC